MLFGKKRFIKTLNSISDEIGSGKLKDHQAGTMIGEAVEKACIKNLIGGMGIAAVGIFAGVGIDNIIRKRRK